MTTSSLHDPESLRLARLIERCCSRATIQMVGAELGAPITPSDDLFAALISAGKASDFKSAVNLVVDHLDCVDHQIDDTELAAEMVERRRMPRMA